MNDKTIVYFDGVCGLCNKLVDWLLIQDRAGKLLFAPLQGESASKTLPSTDTQNLNSIVILKNNRIFRESEAVVELLLELDHLRWAGKLLRVIPKFLRDFGYRMVAKSRYKIWGEKETCRLPTPQERARFLP